MRWPRLSLALSTHQPSLLLMSPRVLTPNLHTWGSPSHRRSKDEASSGLARHAGPPPMTRANTVARPFLAIRCSLKQQKGPYAGPFDGRYWARTSDPQLVELVLSQLS